MLIPVYIECDDIFLFSRIPLSAHRCRGVVVTQVVGIDVTTRVIAVLWTHDVLLII